MSNNYIVRKLKTLLSYEERKHKKEKLKHLMNNNKKKIFYFGVPSHVNLGDQAIAFATKKFMEKYWNDFEILEINSQDTNLLLPFIKKTINSDDVIVFHGGGNMGNLYIEEEKNRRKIVGTFKNNLIISMPQSIYFTDDDFGQNELKKTQSVYSSNDNLVLFAREEMSFKKMTSVFPNTKVLFVPDIVMSMEKKDIPNGSRSGIITMLRKDKEASLNEETLDILNSVLEGRKEIVHKSDTRLKEQTFLTKELREITLDSKWREIGAHRLAVTDRLHGMIFGYITKTPTIVFDNSYNKVSQSYYAYLKDCNYIEYIDEFSREKVEKTINKLLINDSLNHDLSDKYHDLINIINKKIEKQYI